MSYSLPHALTLRDPPRKGQVDLGRGQKPKPEVTFSSLGTSLALRLKLRWCFKSLEITHFQGELLQLLHRDRGVKRNDEVRHDTGLGQLPMLYEGW
jgi:hypothetical protein